MSTSILQVAWEVSSNHIYKPYLNTVWLRLWFVEFANRGSTKLDISTDMGALPAGKSRAAAFGAEDLLHMIWSPVVAKDVASENQTWQLSWILTCVLNCQLLEWCGTCRFPRQFAFDTCELLIVPPSRPIEKWQIVYSFREWHDFRAYANTATPFWHVAKRIILAQDDFSSRKMILPLSFSMALSFVVWVFF